MRFWEGHFSFDPSTEVGIFTNGATFGYIKWECCQLVVRTGNQLMFCHLKGNLVDWVDMGCGELT